MKKTKVVLSLIVLTLFGGIFNIDAYAQTQDEQIQSGVIEAIQYGDIDEADNCLPDNPYARSVYSEYAQIQSVATSIENAAKNGQSSVTVNVRDYMIPVSQVSEFGRKLVNSCPQLFYMNNGFSYYSSTINGTSYITSIIFTINTSIKKADGSTVSTSVAVEQYNTALKSYVDNIDDSWTDMEKVLYVNDNICYNAYYDSGLQYYDAYHLLVDNTAVCQGYTLAVTAILNELKIPVSYANSSAINHIWNVVQLGDNWYELDVTWDDPVPDTKGNAGHTYFLLSDTKMLQNNPKRSDWVTEYQCVDTTYDTAVWSESDTPFYHADDGVYGISNGVIRNYDVINTGEQDVLTNGSKSYDIIYNHGKWYVYGAPSFYNECFSGFGYYKGKLYFNTKERIFELDTSTMKATALTTDSILTENLKKGYIYGMYMDGREVHYTVNTNWNTVVAANQIYTVPEIPDYEITVTSRLKSGGAASIADVTISGDGAYYQGKNVTVTANPKPGYSFAGWYEKVADGTAYGTTPIASTLVYTFIAQKDIQLVAVYEANSGVTLSITNNSEYKVNDVAKVSEYTGTFSAGSIVNVEATGNNFQYWINSGNRIVSTSRTYSFALISYTKLTAVYSDNNAAESSFVKFVSDYNQICSADTFSVNDDIVYPVSPSKTGYTFTGWNMTKDQIKAAIQAGSTIITVKPIYEKNDEVYDMGIYFDGTIDELYPGISEDMIQSRLDVPVGTFITVSAIDITGKQFSYWALDEDGTKIVSYNKDYYFELNGFTELFAIYTTAQDTVKAVPTIAITNIYKSVTTVDNISTHKVSFVATRSLPEGYTLIEQGALYSKTGFSENEFTDGTDGVFKYISADTCNNGVLTVNARVSSLDENVYVRAYMYVMDNETGNTMLIYSDISSANYNSIR